jgi:hypothetical protein
VSTRDETREPREEPAERDPDDRDVFCVAALARGFGEARRVLFGAALRDLFGAAFRDFFGAALRVFFGAAFRLAPRFATTVRFRVVVGLRAVLRREVFREPPRPVFFAFLTT